MKKRKRGGQSGNKNAAKGRKEYMNIFGQRWPVELGKKILAYLERTGQSQKQYLDVQVGRDIFNENDGEGNV